MTDINQLIRAEIGIRVLGTGCSNFTQVTLRASKYPARELCNEPSTEIN